MTRIETLQTKVEELNKIKEMKWKNYRTKSTSYTFDGSLR